MLNGTSIVKKSYEQEWTMDHSVERPSLATSVSSSSPVLLNDIEDLSTWLQQVSLVSPSAQPAASLEPMTSATCGRPQRNAFASYSPDMRCWRTFQPSLLADISDEFSATWPKWGWMHDGECSALAPLVRHTHGKDCSLWPTPLVADCKAGFNNLIEAKRSANQERRKSGHAVQRRIPYDYLLRYGQPCPAIFYEWLMGIPIGATELKPLGMDGFRLWRQQHGKY